MSMYISTSEQANGDKYPCRKVPDDFREEYPAIAEVLGGVPQTDSQAVAVPGATIMLFYEAGTFKFCISPHVGGQVAFGTLPDPSKGFLGIEDAITLGRFEWKRRGRKSS